jgi:archaellum component FlaC
MIPLPWWTSAPDWIVAAVALLTYVGSFIALWNRFTRKVNGYGTRLDTTTASVAHNAGRLDRMEREMTDSRSDINDVHQRLGRVEKSVDELHDQVNDSRIVIMGAISDLKTNVLKDDANVRERVARLEATSAQQSSDKTRRSP